MNNNHRAGVAGFLHQIGILPRRLWMETPGVEATVPMLRGTWGATLHDAEQQAYQDVFGGEDSPDATPGYLLRPAPPDPRCAPAVDFFLFGQAIQHDDTCRRAWQEAARRGLGPKRRPFRIRGTFVLDATGTLKEEPPAADSVGNALRGVPPAQPPTPNHLAWPLSQAVWPLDHSAPCRMVFNSPLRLRRRGRLIEQPNLADIVVAACRRIAAFLPESLRDDWKGYSTAALERARHVPHSAWQGARLDLHRWSARQQSELDLHGVVGCLELRDGPGELAPLLAAARWLHIGKATVMGLGQFDVVAG